MQVELAEHFIFPDLDLIILKVFSSFLIFKNIELCNYNMFLYTESCIHRLLSLLPSSICFT